MKNTKCKIITTILLVTFFILSGNISQAGDSSMEKVTYSENSDVQSSIDEELFEEESEYEEYDVYSEVEDNDNTDTTEMVVLAPTEQVKSNSSTTLHATVEKSYSFRSVEAYNTIWDNSQNFRTMIRTVPSMMQTAPSIIHAANYKFSPDEQTSVYWGHSALSSFNDVSVGFVGKLESSYDTGMKINTKLGRMNVSAAIYDSLETHNPSGGILVSTDELAFKGIKGRFTFGGGVYTNEAGNNSASTNAAGLFAKYKQGRFSLGVQAAQNQYAKSNGSYGTSFYLYPEYQLSKSLYVKSKIAAHLDQNYNQEEIGITYKPYKNNPNEFSVSVGASMFNGEGTTTKQRLKLSTEFKL